MRVYIIMLLLVLCTNVLTYAQDEYILSGTVIDKNEVGLLGAKINIKGDNDFPIITNQKGEFKMLVKGTETLEVSYLEGEKKYIEIARQKTIEILIREEAVVLQIEDLNIDDNIE
ncbi:carboxypeptidase-like regulatory domain-containing protein [Flammeovirga yaeyamensis]|uniref:Carboxypeptidase-like regulatory domain-containing protein n=1 Tax=Flammeovirga yaeyamensis TaxID=367791 RepID=A0AAX1ND28_9BACT|nr:carboxypeptidase-like regulatory domain-containing protein [Flammeovirga yaeyamensis]MBB3696526.1 hypothetical protein [Flammeovirga yaeyamensis]NMF33206.1 hypothetical protein [Flammeovirga yaeyamensis]QWG05514.1 carboxypeptidase-like regulatory domain-containing protein [Flammeovirga yaeyamensis]